MTAPLTDDELAFAKMATVPIPDDTVRFAFTIQKLAWFHEKDEPAVARQFEHTAMEMLEGLSPKEAVARMPAFARSVLAQIQVECRRRLDEETALEAEFQALWERVKDRN